MGFKRTTDGRVFFQGADTANDAEDQQPQQQEQAQTALSQAGGQSQMQILALLKSLNERLKTTQAERNYMRRQLDGYRQIIESLEDKAERNEQSYAKLEKAILTGGVKGGDSAPQMQRTEALMKETLKEMAETRRMIIEIEDKAERADRNASSLQKMQQDQAQKMARNTASYAQMLKRLNETEDKQQTIAAKLDDAISEQAKLVRKIDKTIEDRARFMRKIERIEETVIQTRDALNAKAMVLLTDQGAGIDEEQTLGEALLQQPAPQKVEQPEIASAATVAAAQAQDKRGLYIKAGVIATALLVMAGVVGWVVADMKTPEATIVAPQEMMPSERAEAPPSQWEIQRDTEAFAPQAVKGSTQLSAEQSAALGALDDIGTITVEDDRQLMELLDENPEALATALNDIEPGLSEKLLQQEQAAAQAEETPVEEAAVEEKAEPVIQAQENYVPVAPVGAMARDTSLPDTIKQVEQQAIAGSPEAQHDLAAIYTAGHAGVKQDYNRAAYWFRKAADQGIANAAYNLGVLYHQGLGVRPNINEAIHWYDIAAKIGHPEAQYNLGIAYIEGIGVPYSAEKASQNFEAAAKGGVMEAAYNLGLIYENGLLGEAKPDAALMWYKQAADQGSPEAKAALEQLAKTLNISLEDVNRVVDSMREVKGGALENPQPAPAAPVKTQAPAPVEKASAEPEALTPEELTPEDTAVTQSEPLAAAEQEFEQIVIAQIQEQLMRSGLYPGPADGTLGPQTSDAIRTYQAKNGLSVNGVASTDLLSHMLAGSGMEQGSREN